MNIFYRNGRLYARADSLKDIQTLLAMKSNPSQKEDSPVSSKYNAWKHKHRKVCPVPGCGKRIKNLPLHNYWKHRPQS